TARVLAGLAPPPLPSVRLIVPLLVLVSGPVAVNVAFCGWKPQEQGNVTFDWMTTVPALASGPLTRRATGLWSACTLSVPVPVLIKVPLMTLVVSSTSWRVPLLSRGPAMVLLERESVPLLVSKPGPGILLPFARRMVVPLRMVPGASAAPLRVSVGLIVPLL